MFLDTYYDTVKLYSTDDHEKVSQVPENMFRLAFLWALVCLYSHCAQELFISDMKSLGQSSVQKPKIPYLLSVCHQKVSYGLCVPTAGLTVIGIPTV